MKYLLTLIFSNLFILPSLAYESMIREGYANCMTCHISVHGGGLLNNYGKVISQELSTFGKTMMPTKRRYEHAIQARVARYENDSQVRTFPMQLDYLSAFRSGPTVYQATLAKAPKSKNGEKTNIENELYFRKLTVEHKVNDYITVIGGRDYLNFGLKLLDHTLYIKSNNRRGVTDFVTLLGISIQSERSQISASVYGPSFQEETNNQESGITGKYDFYLLPNKSVLSISALQGSTKEIDRSEFALSAKTSFFDFLLMGQIDHGERKINDSSRSFKQKASFVKLSYFPYQNLEFHGVKESLDIESPFLTKVEKEGYGIKWKATSFLSVEYDQKRILRTTATTQHMFQLFYNGWFL